MVLCGLLAGAATVEWNHNAPAEKVTHYVVEHRAVDAAAWVRVEVPATQNKVTIPESAYGRWFRLAAVNSFGQGEWTEPAKLPEKVVGLKYVIEITP